MTELTKEYAMSFVDPCGFVRAFWKRLSEYRLAGDTRTQKAIFEELNSYYESVFGVPRFASNDAFKKFMRRNPKCRI